LWATTIKSDGNVVLGAEDTLRHELGLAPIKVPTSTTTTTTRATTTTTFTNF
jgi:hypothetical protein